MMWSMQLRFCFSVLRYLACLKLVGSGHIFCKSIQTPTSGLRLELTSLYRFVVFQSCVARMSKVSDWYTAKQKLNSQDRRILAVYIFSALLSRYFLGEFSISCFVVEPAATPIINNISSTSPSSSQTEFNLDYFLQIFIYLMAFILTILQ